MGRDNLTFLSRYNTPIISLRKLIKQIQRFTNNDKSTGFAQPLCNLYSVERTLRKTILGKPHAIFPITSNFINYDRTGIKKRQNHEITRFRFITPVNYKLLLLSFFPPFGRSHYYRSPR